MRFITYFTAILTFLSAVGFTSVIFLPTWDAYVAQASIDFSRIDAVTGNFVANYTSTTYLLRNVVVVFVWLCAIAYIFYGAANDHLFRSKDTPQINAPTKIHLSRMDNSMKAKKAKKYESIDQAEIGEKTPDYSLSTKDEYYARYTGTYWLGLILTTLLESYIVSVFCGINTITLNLMTAVTGAFVWVLIGPVHNRLNYEKGLVQREWIAYTLGVIVFIIYSFLTIIYLVQAQVLGPGNAPWSVWALVFGDWASKLVILAAQYFFWSRVSKRVIVYVLFFAHVFAVLLVPWLFFARTVDFTP
jgi:hypothetical protein